MIVPMHHHELVRRHALLRHIPGLARPTETNAFPLTDRIEREPNMLPYGFSSLVHHRARLLFQISVEELAERPFADEADPGRVFLCVVRQAGLPRDAPHLGFLQLTDRE